MVRDMFVEKVAHGTQGDMHIDQCFGVVAVPHDLLEIFDTDTRFVHMCGEGMA